MFAWWGRTVYRFRYIVIGVMVALCLGGGIYGADLGKHVTQSGYYNEESQSVQASVLGDEAYGRDRNSLVVAILTPPNDGKVTDPAWQKKVRDELDAFVNDKNHKAKVLQWVGWLKAPDADPNTPVGAKVQAMKTADLKHTFVTIPIAGDDDDTILSNYQDVAPDLKKINDGNIKLAGMEPLASELTGTIGTDQKRAEFAIVPLVAIVLFFVFGGAVAAALPAIIGGLTIAGALGILRLTAEFGQVHFFAQPVVTMMGFGIAIDYGLFIVSRFREELAEGYDVEAAVRRSVMTSGRTVAFSAVIIVASSLPLLLIPLGFLKSITYAIIASVLLAAILSNTVLPAVLGILGPNVDALGVRTLLRIPFLANWPFSRRIIDWFAEKTQKTKTRAEVEQGFWGRLVNVVMKRPLAFAAPIVIAMILMVIPIGQLALGGLSEKYLPPDNPVRMAQAEFDHIFPGFRTDPLTLVIKSNDGQPITDQQIDQVRASASTISGFVVPDDDQSKMWGERDGKTNDPSIRVLQNALVNPNGVAEKLNELRALQAPHGLTLLVGGTPALAQDSISTLFEKLPLMVVLLVATTSVLMFLAFGSLVLPVKAALMSALTLGSTMGILTWMFVESGHGSGLFNYTPQPLLAPMIGLIIAVIWGLSTDYEVFLVSRMVEARERGMSTAEAIRIGTATTGRLITGAALVLAVVVAAFAFSDLVVMKYLAFGLLIALLLDATVIRMFLVPAVMKMLGDDCWWAPLWMKRLQQRIGLGETELPDERKRPTVREPADDERALVGAGAPPATSTRPHDPTHPSAEPRPIPPRTNAPSAAGTTRMAPSEPTRQVPSAYPPGVPVMQQQAEEPPTTRLAMARNAVRNAVTSAVNTATGHGNAPTQRAPLPPTQPTPLPPTQPTPLPPAAAPQREEREIESWLGTLRGGPSAKPASPPPPVRPSADSTRAMPQSHNDDAAPTTAFSAQKPTADRGSSDATTAMPSLRQHDQEPSTEKLNTGDDEPKRRGGGMSAQDLLRREGRL
ncbi:MMPL family transporter [Mycobacterium sp. 141]|uniref:MMPL family transporter n=1 Tax=Mycobacterium sp. 141 TaxID=1120797 RepID=UPI00035F12CE|nr:MMPL family transporter [Mycobacterium sp. 141]